MKVTNEQMVESYHDYVKKQKIKMPSLKQEEDVCIKYDSEKQITDWAENQINKAADDWDRAEPSLSNTAIGSKSLGTAIGMTGHEGPSGLSGIPGNLSTATSTYSYELNMDPISEFVPKNQYDPYIEDNSMFLKPSEVENGLYINITNLVEDLVNNEIGWQEVSEEEHDVIYDRLYDLVFKHQIMTEKEKKENKIKKPSRRKV